MRFPPNGCPAAAEPFSVLAFGLNAQMNSGSRKYPWGYARRRPAGADDDTIEGIRRGGVEP